MPNTAEEIVIEKEEVKGKIDEDIDEEKAVHVKGKEGKDEPPVGSPRWNEVYWKSKENERRIKELEEDKTVMRKHNEELAAILEKSVNKKEEKEEIKEEKKIPISNIDKQIFELKQVRKAAYKDMEFEKLADIQEQLDDLIDLKHKNEIAVSKESIKKEASTETANEIISDWSNSTGWYEPTVNGKPNPNFSQAMQNHACLTDVDLQKTFKGSLKQRLEKVREIVEADFNYNKGKEELEEKPLPKSKMPSVGKASTGLVSGSEVKITLTDAERRVAYNMFPDDEDAEKRYFNQKQAIAKMWR